MGLNTTNIFNIYLRIYSIYLYTLILITLYGHKTISYFHCINIKKEYVPRS